MEEDLVKEPLERRIFLIRGHRVMLDSDLARLYGVKTSELNKAVSRNRDRFPDDFMFQLTKKEFDNLTSQTVTSSWGGVRKPPRVFTEQGVAMLSSVLRSQKAIAVNIQIMRTFARLREILAPYEELARKLATMEQKYDEAFRIVFTELKRLRGGRPVKGKRQIGFKKE